MTLRDDIVPENVSLRDLILKCTKCSVLSQARNSAVPAFVGKNYVKGKGLALFAEAPGADEDKLGVPMVGRAGKLMDALLLQAGMSRDDVLILNRIRCQPIRNRIQDFPDAVLSCDEWTQKELAEYDPRVVVCCGNTAMRAVFGISSNITSTRGTVRATTSAFEYGARIYTATWHPSAVLRAGGLGSDMAKQSVSDLELAKELLNA